MAHFLSAGINRDSRHLHSKFILELLKQEEREKLRQSNYLPN